MKKPPKFHPGQAVACIKNDWKRESGHPGIAPIKLGQIVHVAELTEWFGKNYIRLQETGPDWFWEEGFIPVEELPSESIEALLEDLLCIPA